MRFSNTKRPRKNTWMLSSAAPILSSCNRKNELQRLVIWAREKNLAGPLALYRNRLADGERRLLWYAVTYPRSASLARMLSLLNRLLFPPPRYLPKGSARIYRYGWLTKQTKSHSIL